MKSREAIEALHVEWLPFRLTQADAAQFEPEFELLDAHSDEVAGLIWLLLDAVGKFCDSAASLLAGRIDPASFFLVVQGNGRAMALSEDQFHPEKVKSNDEEFRRGHYERWSDKFAEVEPTAIPEEVKGSLHTGPMAVGSRLHVLTPKALGLPSGLK